MEQKRLKGFPLTFNIYAYDEQEIEECRQAVITFISMQATQHRAVTARKVTNALRNWDKNLLVKNQIIKYFQT